MYTKTTHHIRVSVESLFLEDQSLPTDHHYVWGYQIWIENQGVEMIQLLSRTWRITDGNGAISEIKGEGVIGGKPWITPGTTYHYTSGAVLHTPSGVMEGLYHMKLKSGKEFEIEIPAFSLDSPYETAAIH